MKEPVRFPINAKKIISEQELKELLDALGQKITRRMNKMNPVVISILHGGLIFSGEMLTRFNFALQQDYLHATRYANEFKGGALSWLAKPTIEMKGRTVLLLDDVFDEGDTLKAVHDFCYESGAEKVYSAVLIKKSKSREIDYVPDFYATTVADYYLFGMGMDYKGYWRNTRAIYAIEN